MDFGMIVTRQIYRYQLYYSYEQMGDENRNFSSATHDKNAINHPSGNQQPFWCADLVHNQP
jgi:hypothetical protein